MYSFHTSLTMYDTYRMIRICRAPFYNYSTMAGFIIISSIHSPPMIYHICPGPNMTNPELLSQLPDPASATQIQPQPQNPARPPSSAQPIPATPASRVDHQLQIRRATKPPAATRQEYQANPQITSEQRQAERQGPAGEVERRTAKICRGCTVASGRS